MDEPTGYAAPSLWDPPPDTRVSHLASARPCETCGMSFRPTRREGRFCSVGCVPHQRISDEERTRRDVARFWRRVLVGEGCWEWQGARDKKGYGVTLRHAVNRFAHRVSYEFNVGPIPEGMDVLHHCDNPGCVRPAHLFLGTNDDNVADMVAKGRQLRGGRHHWAKLTEGQVREIRAAFAAGTRQIDLARRHGVTQGAISFIVRGANWRSVA